MYNFSKEEISNVILETKSMTAAAKLLNVKYDTFKKFAKKYNLFNTNEPGVGIKKSVKYKTPDDVFQDKYEIPTGVLKSWLLDERDWKCEECEISEWRNKPLPLEIDHCDGVRTNNLRNNLKILCPNCHSQTENWRGRGVNNTNKHVKKVSDNELITALKEKKSIREALLEVGLTAKGGNYKRVYKLLYEQ
jgi:hypothetical protein